MRLAHIFLIILLLAFRPVRSFPAETLRLLSEPAFTPTPTPTFLVRVQLRIPIVQTLTTAVSSENFIANKIAVGKFQTAISSALGGKPVVVESAVDRYVRRALRSESNGQLASRTSYEAAFENSANSGLMQTPWKIDIPHVQDRALTSALEVHYTVVLEKLNIDPATYTLSTDFASELTALLNSLASLSLPSIISALSDGGITVQSVQAAVPPGRISDIEVVVLQSAPTPAPSSSSGQGDVHSAKTKVAVIAGCGGAIVILLIAVKFFALHEWRPHTLEEDAQIASKNQSKVIPADEEEGNGNEASSDPAAVTGGAQKPKFKKRMSAAHLRDVRDSGQTTPNGYIQIRHGINTISTDQEHNLPAGATQERREPSFVHVPGVAPTNKAVHVKDSDPQSL